MPKSFISSNLSIAFMKLPLSSFSSIISFPFKSLALKVLRLIPQIFALLVVNNVRKSLSVAKMALSLINKANKINENFFNIIPPMYVMLSNNI